MTALRADVLDLTKQLIAIESHKDAVGREAAIGRFLVSWFTERGIASRLQPVVDGRANVIARIPGGHGPSLMLCGHLDTVPAGDMPDAFAPRVEGDFLWGRGACDMKGAVAAMACTLVRIQESIEAGKLMLAGDLLFVGTADEETGGLGVKAVIDAGIRTDYAVVGEPTSLRVALAHKGACFVRVTLTGRGAHGSCPDEGVSAVSHAMRLVEILEGEYRATLRTRTHPLLGTATINVGRVCGGTQPNIVAERCEIDIDRRTVPGDREALREIEAIVERICGPIDGLSHEVTEMAMTSVVPHTALEASPDSLLAEAAFEAGGIADTNPAGVTYWTDGGHLADNGIETIIFGPGDIAHAHGPREHVHVDDLQKTVAIYNSIARRLLITD